MKKTIIAAAVAAAALTTGANAAEVYNADGTSLSIGGRVEARLQQQDGDANDRTRARLNFEGKHQVNDNLYGLAKFETEWAKNEHDGRLDSNDTDIDTRYLFAGLGMDAGEITYGQQDGALVHLTNFTDIMSTWGKAASVDYDGNQLDTADQYNSLAGRTDNYLAYNAQFDALGVSAGYRFADGENATDRDNRVDNSQDGYALSLTYGIADTGVIVGGGYSEQNDNEQAMVTTAFTYDALYLAALYTHVDYDDNTLHNYEGYEFAAAYTIDKTKFVATYNKGERKYDTVDVLSAEVNYFFTPSLFGYVGYKWNLLDDSDKKSLSDSNGILYNVDKQDQAMVGLQYRF